MSYEEDTGALAPHSLSHEEEDTCVSYEEDTGALAPHSLCRVCVCVCVFVCVHNTYLYMCIYICIYAYISLYVQISRQREFVWVWPHPRQTIFFQFREPRLHNFILFLVFACQDSLNLPRIGIG